MQSKLWHVLLILSSIREIVKYYLGVNTFDEYMLHRMFPKNFGYLTLTASVYDKLYSIRKLEHSEQKIKTKEIVTLYESLEKDFLALFYKELENGVPKDVQDISLEDEYLKDLKITFNSLRL